MFHSCMQMSTMPTDGCVCTCLGIHHLCVYNFYMHNSSLTCSAAAPGIWPARAL